MHELGDVPYYWMSQEQMKNSRRICPMILFYLFFKQLVYLYVSLCSSNRLPKNYESLLINIDRNTISALRNKIWTLHRDSDELLEMHTLKKWIGVPRERKNPSQIANSKNIHPAIVCKYLLSLLSIPCARILSLNHKYRKRFSYHNLSNSLPINKNLLQGNRRA